MGDAHLEDFAGSDLEHDLAVKSQESYSRHTS
jgi:hypothetical protein